MPRQAMVIVPGFPQHIALRSHNRKPGSEKQIFAGFAFP